VAAESARLDCRCDPVGAQDNPLPGRCRRELLEQAGSAGNLPTDAHLAALAIEHGADIVTFDRDFATFSVRVQVPS
jgi:predicted nucleic acid-binding protein